MYFIVLTTRISVLEYLMNLKGYGVFCHLRGGTEKKHENAHSDMVAGTWTEILMKNLLNMKVNI